MKISLKLSFELGYLDTFFFENIFDTYLRFDPYGCGFKSNTYAWNEKKFRKQLSKYKGDVHGSAYDLKGNIISFNRTGTRTPHLSITITLDDTFFSPTNKEIENLIYRPGFVAAYLFNRDYNHIQSQKFQNEFDERSVSKEILDTIKNTPYSIGVHGNKEYDVRFNPGRSMLIGYTWLIPAYKMWFGPAFYKLVPKERIASFTEAIEVKEVLPDIMYIQLFKDISESHTPDSRYHQWKWQEWIDFDGLEKKYP